MGIEERNDPSGKPRAFEQCRPPTYPATVNKRSNENSLNEAIADKRTAVSFISAHQSAVFRLVGQQQQRRRER